MKLVYRNKPAVGDTGIATCVSVEPYVLDVYFAPRWPVIELRNWAA